MNKVVWAVNLHRGINNCDWTLSAINILVASPHGDRLWIPTSTDRGFSVVHQLRQTSHAKRPWTTTTEATTAFYRTHYALGKHRQAGVSCSTCSTIISVLGKVRTVEERDKALQAAATISKIITFDARPIAVTWCGPKNQNIWCAASCWYNPHNVFSIVGWNIIQASSSTAQKEQRYHKNKNKLAYFLLKMDTICSTKHRIRNKSRLKLRTQRYDAHWSTIASDTIICFDSITPHLRTVSWVAQGHAFRLETLREVQKKRRDVDFLAA